MDQSRVKAIVDRELPAMARRLHVADWRLRTFFEHSRMSGDCMAECARDVRYRKASLFFDCEKHDDEADVLDSIRHELLHVVLAPFDVLYEHLTAGLDGVAKQQAIFLWNVAVEQSIDTLEKAFNEVAPLGNPAAQGPASPAEERSS